MELLHSHGQGPELRKARSLGTTWTYLEDYLCEKMERVDNLLSSTLKTERPVSDDKVFLYYQKVCHFLDTPEGRGTVSDHVTLDHLDILLSMLPAEETFLWGGRVRGVSPEDIRNVFHGFCMDRAEELKLQILSPMRTGDPTQMPTPPRSEPSWRGHCILGELCEGNHMPEVCQLFEAITSESRLAIIQRKQLCQFCFWHADTQPCPSHSQPECPIRGCMRMHHRLLHNALLKEEARAIVVKVEPELDELDAEEEFHVTGFEDLEQLTSDESGGESGRG
jgi:hypothetical protein